MNHENRGLLFDRYIPVGDLGSGYFGAVFLARDQDLGRNLAIKELKPQFLEDEGTLKRFADDARIAASLGHPNIVTVYDLRPRPPEKPRYILMEFMTGGSLEKLLKRQRQLPVPEAVQVTLCLCRALQATHSRGVIHRDIKPGNILLGDEGVCKLADFGIAHLPEKYGGLGTTRPGHPHPCTPAYASPEQIRGSRLDGRSDLYALGVVLHELVTGSFYFDRGAHNSVEACFEAVLHHDPIPPRSINPDVPSRLDGIIMRLLAKSPGDRHPDAAAMIDELESVLPSRAMVHGTVKPQIASMSATAQNEGDLIRYRLRLEAENRGERAALWSGLTINLPCIATREDLDASDLNVSCSRKERPILRAPGDTLYGFRADGSFGEMASTCLFVETAAFAWKPGERVSLDISFLSQRPEVEAHIRTWATWNAKGGQEVTDGDPKWSTQGLRDQQGIRAHRVLVAFYPQ